MKIHLYSPKYYEKWTYYTPDRTGIGGSETAHIETALRLAQNGFDVTSYSPIPNQQEEYGGVQWLDLKDANFNDDGLWIVYRAPQVAEKIKSGRVWVICQDIDYPGEWTKEAVANIQYIYSLCDDHYHFLLNCHPELKDKLRITSNGIKTELINTTKVQKRNPKRLFYASSPDRGLINLIDIFKKAVEFDDELELHVCYGLKNITKTAEKITGTKTFIEKINKALDHPKITHYGRLPQAILYEEWLKSGLWVYPTNFRETNCITSMEAQALGAIPICSDVWALKDKVKFGSMISGNTDDKLIQARYLLEILRLSNPQIQDMIRQSMMDYAREAYSWNDYVIEPMIELIRRDYE